MCSNNVGFYILCINFIFVFFLGHTKHEWTSYSAFESVFKYLEEKYDEFNMSYEQKSKKPKVDN